MPDLRYVPYRHSATGAYPWAVMDTETGAKPIAFPIEASHYDYGTIRTTRYFFQRKRDAQQAIDQALAGELKG